MRLRQDVPVLPNALTQLAKNKILLDFCETLRYNQMIVFSDEGNLFNRHAVSECDQRSEPREKPEGLWFSYGQTWAMYLLDERESWAKLRLNHVTHIYELDIDYTSVLDVDNIRQFNKFEQKYAIKDKDKVNWGKVAKDYMGIKIKMQPKKTCRGMTNTTRRGTGIGISHLGASGIEEPSGTFVS